MTTQDATLSPHHERDVPIARRTGLVDVAAVSVAAVATLVLVLPHYATRPFWFDELVSIEIADLRPTSLLEYVFTEESNMALYHGLLSAWLGIVDGEAGTRILSVVFALLALPFVYALGRRLYDRRTAVMAVALMSVNVSFVGYSRDARSYALTLLLVTASSFYLVRASERSRGRDWTFYAVTASLAVWAHLFAALVLLAHAGWLVTARSSVPWRGAARALAGVTALILPLALAIAIGGQRAQLDWLSAPRLLALPGLVEWFVESRATVVVYFVGGAFALVAALVDWRQHPSRWPRRESLLVLWLAVPPTLALLVSYLTPVYHDRYFLVCLPALVLLVSSGFARMRPLWLGVALAAVAVGLSIRTVESCQPDCKIYHDEWEAAVSYLEARIRPDDAVVVFPEQVRTPVDHYLGRRPTLLFPARWGLLGGVSDGRARLDAAMREVAAYDRIWLVTWWLPAEEAREALARHADPLFERVFQGGASVALYRTRAAGP